MSSAEMNLIDLYASKTLMWFIAPHDHLAGDGCVCFKIQLFIMFASCLPLSNQFTFDRKKYPPVIPNIVRIQSARTKTFSQKKSHREWSLLRIVYPALSQQIFTKSPFETRDKQLKEVRA